MPDTVSLADPTGLAETPVSNGSFVTADHRELDVIQAEITLDFYFRLNYY